jgi:hypothetical protein
MIGDQNINLVAYQLWTALLHTVAFGTPIKRCIDVTSSFVFPFVLSNVGSFNDNDAIRIDTYIRNG